MGRWANWPWILDWARLAELASRQQTMMEDWAMKKFILAAALAGCGLLPVASNSISAMPLGISARAVAPGTDIELVARRGGGGGGGGGARRGGGGGGGHVNRGGGGGGHVNRGGG